MNEGYDNPAAQVAEGSGESLEQQVESWMARYFTLLDEHALALNTLQAIQALLDEGRLRPAIRQAGDK
ncbi:MAG TPA: hypothetical protein VLL25_17410 [Acidimicrobiales bacterium]|nr:hypothetical protein [Acidimicrobiales bacterium]